MTLDVRHRVLLATLVLVLCGVTGALEHRRRTWSVWALGQGQVVLEDRVEVLDLMAATLRRGSGDVLCKEAVEASRWLPRDGARSIDECLAHLRRALPSAPTDALLDLLRRAEQRWELPPGRLGGAGVWPVVSTESLDRSRVFVICGSGMPPDPPGVLRVSAPGLTADGVHAVLYVNRPVGALPALGGELLHLKRIDSRWRLVGRAPVRRP